jgi:hypothetical protein
MVGVPWAVGAAAGVARAGGNPRLRGLVVGGAVVEGLLFLLLVVQLLRAL